MLREGHVAFILIFRIVNDFGIGTYDTKRSKLAKDVAAFLLSNDYIFDKKSPYYLTDTQIRKLVREKMMTRAFEKVNIKDCILTLKESMSKKTK